jgi:cytochrome P450
MFALQVLKISLAMMLQRFRFTIVSAARVDRVVRITMTPRHGLPMLKSRRTIAIFPRATYPDRFTRW